MPNRFTQVPDRPVPRLPAGLGPVVALADVFMVAMLSRPAGGSLSKTWVTPATLWLCLAVALVAVGLGIARLTAGSPLGLLGLVIGLAAGAVCIVGAAQRLSGR